MADTSNKTFHIGLCMAGAVSAGAYTAGVMDYLIEALEVWQRKKASGEPNVPTHDVVISIMGGASAGGMTTVLTSAALHDNFEPVRTVESGNVLAPKPNNKFYHSWVDLTSEDMLSELLDVSDITQHGLKSALNASFIDKIADRAVSVKGERVDRKYIAKNLKLFVTLSNLEGMSYTVTFKSNASQREKYVINVHNDYGCFVLSDEYGNDGWIPLNLKSKLNVDIATDAAMATGAFPVGLKARKVTREPKYMNDNKWFNHITKDAGRPFLKNPYNTLNIDGGMINNEPFEKVREVLKVITDQENENDYESYNTFRSTVLMIDPFPSKEPEEFKPSDKLLSIMGGTLSAMINQSRVKPTTLLKAFESNKADLFLIAPSRKVNGKSEEGDRAIACGALGGFSGFLSKEFRVHDYFLGRANCEKFLRDHFTIPTNNSNPIFKEGYENVTDLKPYTSRIETDLGLQIIPLFHPEGPKYIPKFSNGKDWPTVSQGEINSYKGLLKKRVEKVLLNFADLTKTQRGLMWIGAKVLLNARLADAVINTIVEELEEHNLLK